MLIRLLLNCVLLLLVSCGDTPIKHEKLPNNATILAFGDSVTFGYGATRGEDYPTKLAMITGWKVINEGVNGERTDEGRTRIAEVLKKHNPKMVLIELGGNDFLQRRDPKNIKEDLRFIIKSVKEAHAIPVLIAVPALSPMGVVTGKPSNSPIYKALAQEEKISVIPAVFSNILGDESLKQDQIHPNDKGYEKLAEGIAYHLRKIGLL